METGREIKIVAGIAFFLVLSTAAVVARVQGATTAAASAPTLTMQISPY